MAEFELRRVFKSMKKHYIKYFGTALIILPFILAIVIIVLAIYETYSFSLYQGIPFAFPRFAELAGNGLLFSLAVLCISLPLGRYYHNYGSLPDPLPQRVTRAFMYHLFSLCVIALGAIVLLLYCSIPDACMFFAGPFVFLVLTPLILSAGSFLAGLAFIVFGKK